MDADDLLGENVEEALSGDWQAALDSKTMSYDGVTVAKAQELSTWQVEAALLPKGMAGCVDALELCPPGIAARLFRSLEFDET